MTPEVSVVIPTRNRLELLQQTLATVLGQRGVDLEVIVVDEASSDGTPAWLATLDDPRVRVLRNDPPLRLPGARNAGAALAQAEFLAFTDDDDLWLLDKLRLQLDAVRSDGADWCAGGCIYVDEGLVPIGVHNALPPAELLADLPNYNTIPGGGSGVLVRATTFHAAGEFDVSLHAVEDWECWLRLAEHGKVASVDQPLVAYRRSSRSMSHEIDRMIGALQQVAKKHPEIPVDADGVPAGAVRNLGRLAREAGEWRAAARLMWSDRHDRSTVLRAPLYLFMPRIVMRRSFFLRRGGVRWAQPLVDEIAPYRAG